MLDKDRRPKTDPPLSFAVPSVPSVRLRCASELVSGDGPQSTGRSVKINGTRYTLGPYDKGTDTYELLDPVELCETCGEPVKMMSQRSVGYSSPRCEPRQCSVAPACTEPDGHAGPHLLLTH